MSRIKLCLGDNEVVVDLFDNELTRAIVKEFPITLSFDDYSSTEKIAFLHRKIYAKARSEILHPSAGDFLFYPAWGCMVIFYRDYHIANEYVRLGKVVSGLRHIQGIGDNVKITVCA